MPISRLHCLWFLLIVSFLMPFPVAGEGAAGDGGEKRPFIVSADITGEEKGVAQDFADLFRRSVALELNLEGLSLSDRRNPDVLVRGIFRIEEDSIVFNVSAEAIRTGESLFGLSAREELDFSLDAALLGHARLLVQAITGFYQRNEHVFFRPESGSEAKSGESALIPGKVSPPDESVPGLDVGAARRHGTGIHVAADFGGFFAVGEPARYFKSGYVLSVFAGYAFSPELDLGFSGGAVFYSAEGYAAGARGLILPFGLGLRFRPESSGSVVAGIRMDGGAAVFSVAPEYGSSQAKIIPAGEMGVTVERIGKKLSLQGAVCLTFFIEGESLLYGFSPRIGLSF